MPAFDQLAILFQLLETLQTVPVAETTALVTDAGSTALSVITQTTELSNGIAADVTELCTITDVQATTTGIGVLTVDVGVAGAAIAPALGIAAGVGLYALAPDFWTNITNTLMGIGETIGGKVRCFINGQDETIAFSEATIEAFKEAFIESGIYDDVMVPDEIPATGNSYTVQNGAGLVDAIANVRSLGSNYLIDSELDLLLDYVTNNYPALLDNKWWYISTFDYPLYGYGLYFARCAPSAVSGEVAYGQEYFTDLKTLVPESNYYIHNFANDPTNNVITHDTILLNNANVPIRCKLTTDAAPYYRFYANGAITYTPSQNIQDGAVLPSADPFSETYPLWMPYMLPDEVTKVYPITMPVQNPDPLQEPAQNPDPLPESDPQSVLDFLIDNLQLPDPNPNPVPSPVPDPDPQPQPDPIPEQNPDPGTNPNPIDPNPTPGPSPTPIVPDLPDTVPANAMFTVYAPTIAQVNSFGGWLWNNNIIEQIKRIWNNPLDGIISFMKVYAVPTTGGSDTIKVGVLDSGVSSAVVSSQFVTVNCGSISINEKFYNATDYSPFVGMHLYLPFIGIVELDCDEFMKGSISVVYHIDVYTGTCLAEVKCTRSPDMPDATIIYTFSGNASQQLPLTSAEFGGAISALVGVVGGGLAIASGGGLGLLAGATGIAHAVTHEMVHIAHSGSLSANAGIMGARKPFLILTRRRSYDANGYNQLYGYPSNKTVYLGNCAGLVKVKDIQLKTSATEAEANEIVSLLKSGVII